MCAAGTRVPEPPEDGRRVRVLHVVTSMNVGGTETYVLNVLRHCDCSRFQMDVCYTGPEAGSLAPDVTALGARLVPCRYTNMLLPFVWRLARTLASGRYDAVCDYAGDLAAGSLLAARLAGVPARLALYRSSHVKYRRTPLRRLAAQWQRRLVLQYATRVLSNSRANLAARFDPDDIDDRFAVVRNGVDLSRFVPAQAHLRSRLRRQLGLPDDAFVIGHVGSLTPPKAHDVLVQAFSELPPQGSAHLLLVGDGPLRAGVEAQARRLGVADRVTFTGVRHDVPDLLHAMDVFVLPSRFEGFPNALIEAQAAALPIVASDRPELREAVPPENHDCLVPVDDPSALARVIASLWGDPSGSRRRGAAGAAFVTRELQMSDAVAAFCRYMLPPATRRPALQAVAP